MGENEQGGMLRTVAVVGLVAIIAAIVIFAVTGLKNASSQHRDQVTTAVKKSVDPDYGRNLITMVPTDKFVFSSGTTPGHWTYTHKYEVVARLEPGVTYTFSAEATLVGTNQTTATVSVWNPSTTQMYATKGFKATGVRDSFTFTIPANANTRDGILMLYAGNSGSTTGNTITWTNMKLEKGKDATPYWM